MLFPCSTLDGLADRNQRVRFRLRRFDHGFLLRMESSFDHSLSLALAYSTSTGRYWFHRGGALRKYRISYSHLAKEWLKLLLDATPIRTGIALNFSTGIGDYVDGSVMTFSGPT